MAVICLKKMIPLLGSQTNILDHPVLDIYKSIIERIDNFLKPDGALMMEIGYAQGPAIRKLLEANGIFKEITIEKDFANNDRIAIAEK